MPSTIIHSTNNQTNSTDQFIEHIMKQTISIAEIIAERYVQKVTDEKKKILNNQKNLRNHRLLIQS